MSKGDAKPPSPVSPVYPTMWRTISFPSHTPAIIAVSFLHSTRGARILDKYRSGDNLMQIPQYHCFFILYVTYCTSTVLYRTVHFWPLGMQVDMENSTKSCHTYRYPTQNDQKLRQDQCTIVLEVEQNTRVDYS